MQAEAIVRRMMAEDRLAGSMDQVAGIVRLCDGGTGTAGTAAAGPLGDSVAAVCGHANAAVEAIVAAEPAWAAAHGL